MKKMSFPDLFGEFIRFFVGAQRAVPFSLYGLVMGEYN